MTAAEPGGACFSHAVTGAGGPLGACFSHAGTGAGEPRGACFSHARMGGELCLLPRAGGSGVRQQGHGLCRVSLSGLSLAQRPPLLPKGTAISAVFCGGSPFRRLGALSSKERWAFHNAENGTVCFIYAIVMCTLFNNTKGFESALPYTENPCKMGKLK